MASSLDVKSRDGRKELDPDDPLMELTRIMGFAPKRDDAIEPADPQLSIEDDFSLDLEQELQRTDDLALKDDDFSLPDEFGQAFDEEFAQSMQVEDETPSVMPSPPLVPSLEDELEALLAEPVEPAARELEYYAGEDNEALAVEHIEPGYETEQEPWLDSSGEPDEPAVQSMDLALSDPYDQETDDPILSQMNRVFGRSNLKPLDTVTPELSATTFEELPAQSTDYAQAAATSVNEFDAQAIAVDPVSEVEDFDFEEVQVDLSAKSNAAEINNIDWNPSTLDEERGNDATVELDRLIGKTGLEPVVEAVDIESYAVEAIDELDIPDFDLPTEKVAADTASYELDDDYQGYEPPVVATHFDPTKAAGAQAIDSEVSMHQDDADFDFESMLNDELSASVDHTGNQNSYGAAVAPALAGASDYRPQANSYGDELPESLPENDDLDAPVAYHEPAPRKTGWLVAAAIGAIALIGAGYYAISGQAGIAQGNAPALVKADPEPIKVAPETPGGKTVSNQDLAVYDKVGGEAPALPSQGQLISESEEPVDIASVATNEPANGTAKSEERIDPALEAEIASGQASDTLAVSPKKVRTMVVKPDGTLVERPAEPVAAAPAVAAPAAPEVQEPNVASETTVPAVATPVAKAEEAANTVETAVVAPAQEVTPDAPKTDTAAKTEEKAVETPQPAAPAIKVVKTKKIKAPAVAPEAKVAQTATGEAPVLESRPSDQPVNIVGKTGNAEAAAETQVAAADPVETPVASGTYSMQIASTPSPEAAKSTYVALTRKFGSVLIGRGVSVQKAQVEGKGTVYRVRIPAGTKQEAAALCQQYKAAGGNCFISK